MESLDEVIVSAPASSPISSVATPATPATPSPETNQAILDVKNRVEKGEEEIKAANKKTHKFSNLLKNLKSTTAVVIGLVVVALVLGIVAIVVGSLAYAARNNGSGSGSGPIDIGQNSITAGNITSSGKITAENIASSGDVTAAKIASMGDITAGSITSGDIVSTGKISAVDITATTINPTGGWNFTNLNVVDTITATDVVSTTLTTTGNISGGGLLTLNNQPSQLFSFTNDVAVTPETVVPLSNCFFGIPVAGLSQGTADTWVVTDEAGSVFTIQTAGIYLFSMSTRWNNPQNPQLEGPELWMSFTTSDSWDLMNNRYGWINFCAGAQYGPPLFAQKKCSKGERMQVLAWNPNASGSAAVTVGSAQGMIITRLF